MPTELRDGDKLGNCRPGTVVDTTILVQQEFDFCKRKISYEYFFLNIFILTLFSF
jgi:hypothetical protein